MADLITITQAKLRINQASYTVDENSLLSALITSCTKGISKYCSRNFDQQTYDELYNGSNHRQLVLRQFPIQSISRVAGNPTPVLYVSNTSSSVQRARVAVTSTGITLTRVVSGTSTTDTLTFAANATITALKTAIDALGNGWTATIAGSTYTNYPSADLRAPQGALAADNSQQAGLSIHVTEITSYDIDADHGVLTMDQNLFWESGPGASGGIFGMSGWNLGIRNYRVVFSAGFTTVPEDVQEACAAWVAALFLWYHRDPNTQFKVTGAAASESWTKMESPPAYVKGLLLPYRKHSIGG